MLSVLISFPSVNVGGALVIVAVVEGMLEVFKVLEVVEAVVLTVVELFSIKHTISVL